MYILGSTSNLPKLCTKYYYNRTVASRHKQKCHMGGNNCISLWFDKYNPNKPKYPKNQSQFLPFCCDPVASINLQSGAYQFVTKNVTCGKYHEAHLFIFKQHPQTTNAEKQYRIKWVVWKIACILCNFCIPKEHHPDFSRIKSQVVNI